MFKTKIKYIITLTIIHMCLIADVGPAPELKRALVKLLKLEPFVFSLTESTVVPV